MKTLITYKSKYGTSKQYALFLSEALGCEARSLNYISKNDLDNYNLVIHGGGIYAGKIAGLGFYKKKIEYMNQKGIKLVVFACGASPANRKVDAEMKIKNFTGCMKDVPYFYCEGNYNYAIMTPVHKAMMKIMHKMLTKKITNAEIPDPNDEEFLGLIFSHFERLDKRWIDKIVNYVKSLEIK